jgi:hypothetical protein
MIKVEAEYVDSKHTGKQLETVYDKQLDKMDSNHEDEIIELKLKHAEDHQKLKEQYEKYLKEQEAIKAEKKELEKRRDESEQLMIKAKNRKR